MTLQQAYDALPESAEWSSTFGNPDSETFTEFYRMPDGRRFTIERDGPCDWQCIELEE